MGVGLNGPHAYAFDQVAGWLKVISQALDKFLSQRRLMMCVGSNFFPRLLGSPRNRSGRM
jgi:hypothetical protein